MVIRHTNVAKDRTKLSNVIHDFKNKIEKLVYLKTRDDKMKGWDSSQHSEEILLELRRKLRDLVNRSVHQREKGLEVEIAFTACLIDYIDSINKISVDVTSED